MPSDILTEVSTTDAPKVTPFSTEDLSRVFDAGVVRRGRSLILLESVSVSLKDGSIAVVVDHIGVRYTASITPSPRGSRVGFLNRCSCGQSACAHVAAGALAALDRFPALRRAEQTSFLSALLAPARAESALPTAAGPGDLVASEPAARFRVVSGELPHACFVTTLLIGEQTGAIATTTPARILADRSSNCRAAANDEKSARSRLHCRIE